MARGDGRSSQGQGDGFEGTQTTAALIWLCLSASIGLLLFALYWWKKKDKKKTPTIRIGPNMQPESGAMRAQTAGGMRRRPRTARQRMMTRRQEYDDYDESEEEIFDDGSGDETGPIAPEVPWKDEEPSGKVGTKKLRKLQGKAEKKEQREQEQRDREERKKQEELRIKEQKEEEELERIQQEKEEEQERLRKEEQERKDHEEYLMLKEAFTVEEEGESGLLSEQESQALLQEFIDFVQNKKVVMLEELASHFDLRVQEAIQRLEDLQEMGRLTGVMDDRGKFIYISQEELEDVARYVKQRGRVAISDLAEASSSLISLQGSNSESGINSQPIEVS